MPGFTGTDNFPAKPTWATSPPASEVSGLHGSLAATSSNETAGTSTHPAMQTSLSMDDLQDPTPFQFDPDLGVDLSGVNAADLPVLGDGDEMQIFGGGFDMLDGYWFGAGGAGGGGDGQGEEFDVAGLDLHMGDVE